MVIISHDLIQDDVILHLFIIKIVSVHCATSNTRHNRFQIQYNRCIAHVRLIDKCDDIISSNLIYASTNKNSKCKQFYLNRYFNKTTHESNNKTAAKPPSHMIIHYFFSITLTKRMENPWLSLTVLSYFVHRCRDTQKITQLHYICV